MRVAVQFREPMFDQHRWEGGEESGLVNFLIEKREKETRT